ncbi:MAG: hypothetical protein Q7J32_03340 [Sphingomonadaceae bacterium]|nr:hypothetical protein [Sphingomonadaceae bacterium]
MTDRKTTMTPAATTVSLTRLYVLRAMYLFVAGGLAFAIWPAIISHTPGWPLMNGVVACLLGAVSLGAALGLRYPLQMLPVLLFELVWKLLWLGAVALPLWAGGQMDARTMQTVWECLLGVALLPLVVPWGYVVDRYVRQPGDRWGRAA